MRLSEYTGYLRRFGLVYTLKEIYYRFCSNVIEKIFNLRRDKDTLWALKRCLDEDGPPSIYFKPLKDLKPCLWTCWLQGYDNAPPIVRACIDSMRKFANGYEVVVVTEKTISDYVTMPDHIIDKYRSGVISATHFSDLLRTLLLINYGGVWLDASVLLTQNIPTAIMESDFFVFQSSNLHSGIQPCSSWFISAKRNSPILLKTFDVLCAYWKNHNYLLNYFIFHVAVRLVITYDLEAKRIWDAMFYKNNADPHVLQKKLFDKMDTAMKNYIWNLSFAHKLTYKFNGDSLANIEGTFYQYVIYSCERELAK